MRHLFSMIVFRRRLRLAGCLAALALAPGMVAAQTVESPVAPARQQLTILLESGSAPFSFIDLAGQPAGFAVDLTRAIAEDQGFELKFDQRPWQAVYADFLQGRGDILGLVAFSEERARLMDFSITYELMYCRLYVPTNSEPIRTTTELAGKRIAVIRNAITHEYVARHPEWQATIVPCDSLAECLLAVQKGRADVALGMQFVTDYIIRTQGIEGIEATELELRDMNYQLCFAVHRGETRLLARLNDGLTNVRAHGTYDRLYEKWLGPLKPRKLRWRDFRPFALPTLALIGLAFVVFGWQRRMLARISRNAAALHESEERLSLVLEGSQDGFWDWNVAKGDILRSPRWYAMLGYTAEDLEKSRGAFVGLLHPDDLERVLSSEREIQQGRDHFSTEFRIRTKSGDWKWVLDRGKVVLRDPVTRTPLRITGTQTDITVRKTAEQESEKLQRKMQETQRFESLGLLAGGVA
ncbi:MAG: transporter substrate-binding domain-containing protein, partial [Candidatus Didemnitutus sp.]|nr:transporter substrate-binding domain-containing protein [Candidatus Didemnitutus sp.]